MKIYEVIRANDLSDDKKESIRKRIAESLEEGKLLKVSEYFNYDFEVGNVLDDTVDLIMNRAWVEMEFNI
jgi:ketol-acid reductoisomerase